VQRNELSRRDFLKAAGALGLVAAVGAGGVILTGCSNKSTTSNNSTTPTNTSTSTKPKSDVTVEFSYPPFGYDTNLENVFWKKYIAQFESENPGIKINQTLESYGSGFPFSKWEQAMAAGSTPDIAYESPRHIIDYAMKGYLSPVTDVVNKLGGESAFSPSMHYFKHNNEWYAVPNCDATQVLMYRKDILKSAGYDNPPKNWDELVTVAKACTKGGTYGLVFYICNQYYTLQTVADLMKGAGGKMLDDKGKLVLDSPENLKGLQFLSDLIHVHKILPPDAVAWEYGELVNSLGMGKVAMAIEWGGYATLMQSMFPNTYQNMGYVKIPVGPSGVCGGWQGAGGFFLFKDAKHPEEAKKFIQFMSRPEISKEWCLASGNISPFLSVSNNPDLTKLDWYKAMADQSPSVITMGWDYGIIPGLAECTTPFQTASVNIISGTATPTDALKTLHAQCQDALDKAVK
jgi:multiple sugar transport system substrate-binding protein